MMRLPFLLTRDEKLRATALDLAIKAAPMLLPPGKTTGDKILEQAALIVIWLKTGRL